jgi:hypothetical protein
LGLENETIVHPSRLFATLWNDFSSGSTPDGLLSTAAQPKIAPFVAYCCNTLLTPKLQSGVETKHLPSGVIKRTFRDLVTGVLLELGALDWQETAKIVFFASVPDARAVVYFSSTARRKETNCSGGRYDRSAPGHPRVAR